MLQYYTKVYYLLYTNTILCLRLSLAQCSLKVHNTWATHSVPNAYLPSHMESYTAVM